MRFGFRIGSGGQGGGRSTATDARLCLVSVLSLLDCPRFRFTLKLILVFCRHQDTNNGVSSPDYTIHTDLTSESQRVPGLGASSSDGLSVWLFAICGFLVVIAGLLIAFSSGNTPW